MYMGLSSKYCGSWSDSCSVEVGTKSLGPYCPYWGFQSSIGSEGLNESFFFRTKILQGWDIPEYRGSGPVGWLVGWLCLLKCISKEETISTSQPWGEGGQEEAPHITENHRASKKTSMDGWITSFFVSEETHLAPPHLRCHLRNCDSPLASPMISACNDTNKLRANPQNLSQLWKAIFSLVLANVKDKAGSWAKRGNTQLHPDWPLTSVSPNQLIFPVIQ